jgi:fructosamine-3-kinase
MDTTQLKMVLDKLLLKPVQVYSIHHLGGGEVNYAYRVITDKGVYFVKVHDSKNYPRFFEKELNGLLALKETNTIDVCEPIGTMEIGSNSFLALDYEDAAPMAVNFWEQLGNDMASLHCQTNRYFGFVEDNFLGQCLQINHRMTNWGQFYIKNRLLPNVRAVAEKHLMDANEIKLFEKFFNLVEFAFPEEQPSLLHGDFWKEHVISNAEGKPCLLNPAVYYGHREMDIAKTKMVGTFPQGFYDAYNAAYPLQKDWEDRLDFCKMYYHLVNLNIYGSAYLQNVQQILHKWVS